MQLDQWHTVSHLILTLESNSTARKRCWCRDERTRTIVYGYKDSSSNRWPYVSRVASRQSRRHVETRERGWTLHCYRVLWLLANLEAVKIELAPLENPTALGIQFAGFPSIGQSILCKIKRFAININRQIYIRAMIDTKIICCLFTVLVCLWNEWSLICRQRIRHMLFLLCNLKLAWWRKSMFAWSYLQATLEWRSSLVPLSIIDLYTGTGKSGIPSHAWSESEFKNVGTVIHLFNHEVVLIVDFKSSKAIKVFWYYTGFPESSVKCFGSLDPMLIAVRVDCCNVKLLNTAKKIVRRR